MNTAITLVKPSESREYPSILPEGTTDALLIDMWLAEEERSPNTIDAYKRDVGMFLDFVQKPLQWVTLADVKAYHKSLVGKETTKNRRMAVVKSLLSFGARTRYLSFNVGSMVKLKGTPSGLAQRILPEAQVTHMILSETNKRNRAILHLLYHCGLRVSELVNLQWNALVPRDNGKGQITVIGKGNKERHIMVESGMWDELMELQAQATGPEVFVSRNRSRNGSRKLGRAQVWAIVRDAAKRSGINVNFSPHWMRHAHASHALDRGASPALVQVTLGHESLVTTTKYTHARPEDSSSRYIAM